MTDTFPTRPIAIRHPGLPRTTLPKIRIGAAFVSLLTTIAVAKVQAYLAPCQGRGGRARVDLSPEEQGRDPSW